MWTVYNKTTTELVMEPTDIEANILDCLVSHVPNISNSVSPSAHFQPMPVKSGVLQGSIIGIPGEN